MIKFIITLKEAPQNLIPILKNIRALNLYAGLPINIQDKNVK